MTRITAQIPDDLAVRMKQTARQLNHSRNELIRRALEAYLEDQEDLLRGLEARHDSTDPILDWDDARRELLAQD